MLDHLTIRASDRPASERFYRLVLATLGIEPTSTGPDFLEFDDFSITAAEDESAVTRRLHIGFVAPSREHVDAFWRAGTQAGHPDDGRPGPRPQYRDDYYGAFLLDPDGNSAEAVHHGALRDDGVIDHAWIRVADVAATCAFYERAAQFAAFRPAARADDRVRFAATGPHGGSATFLAGEPTRNVHLAFGAADNATVDAFHAALTGDGHPSHGTPGERPRYHRGYYAAFVLDPDGNNVEAVCHNR